MLSKVIENEYNVKKKMDLLLSNFPEGIRDHYNHTLIKLNF